MKRLIQYLSLITVLALAGCASQSPRLADTTDSLADTPPPTTVTPEGVQENATPAVTKLKGDRTLSLIKLMEGGVCKNDDQGAQGIFLLYASPEDFKRIKQKQGVEIFKNLEADIQGFALAAFKQAVNNTQIAISPFALDQTDAQNTVGAELIKRFKAAVQTYIAEFEQKTTLSIDIEPFARSFRFYDRGCDITDSTTAAID